MNQKVIQALMILKQHLVQVTNGVAFDCVNKHIIKPSSITNTNLQDGWYILTISGEKYTLQNARDHQFTIDGNQLSNMLCKVI